MPELEVDITVECDSCDAELQIMRIPRGNVLRVRRCDCNEEEIDIAAYNRGYAEAQREHE